MLSSAYFRRQADICLRLSLVASDGAASTRLIAMAKEYLAACEAPEQQPGPGPLDPSRGPKGEVRKPEI
jgi:hypothetical protein